MSSYRPKIKTDSSGTTTDIPLDSETVKGFSVVDANGKMILPLDYSTTVPTAANTNGIKIVVLSSEPATKYSGWLYLITG